MNSFEETEQDDFVFTYQELLASKNAIYPMREGYGLRLAGYDIARYGNDKCAVVVLSQMGAQHWQTAFIDQWEHKDLNYTTGRIFSTSNEQRVDKSIIDEDGIGAGPLDNLNKGRQLANYVGFRNPPLSYEENKFFGNRRTLNAFKVKDMVAKGWLCISNDDLIDELMTLKFTYDNHQRRILVSKEKMRKEGIKSPNLADALIMVVSMIGEINYAQDIQYYRQPAYAKETNFMADAGIR